MEVHSELVPAELDTTRETELMPSGRERSNDSSSGSVMVCPLMTKDQVIGLGPPLLDTEPLNWEREFVQESSPRESEQVGVDESILTETEDVAVFPA